MSCHLELGRYDAPSPDYVLPSSVYGPLRTGISNSSTRTKTNRPSSVQRTARSAEITHFVTWRRGPTLCLQSRFALSAIGRIQHHLDNFAIGGPETPDGNRGSAHMRSAPSSSHPCGHHETVPYATGADAWPISHAPAILAVARAGRGAAVHRCDGGPAAGSRVCGAAETTDAHCGRCRPQFQRWLRLLL